VAAPCRAIQSDPGKVYDFTNKSNTVAIVSDGSRVLGLGDIGPHAGLPVMEGKALLFKYLGGVDAIPICLATQDQQEFVRTVKLLEPSFGGINLEDIAGLARVIRRREEYIESATRRILDAQDTVKILMREGLIAPMPVGLAGATKPDKASRAGLATSPLRPQPKRESTVKKRTLLPGGRVIENS
jgi:hypothetical protein